jgi:hypothetical protein
MGSSWRREGITAPLELIRFAAANRLCVDLNYRDKQGRVSSRLIEPYSLRRTKAGRLLLHAVRHVDGKSRSYYVDSILGATATKTSFVPRYAIELTDSGLIHAPMSARASSFARPPRSVRVLTPAWRRKSIGPSYVYQCSYCGRKFTKKSMDSKLNPHKTKDGWPCSGRTGFYVETKY